MAAPSLSEITSIRGDAEIGAAANGLSLGEIRPDASLPYLQAAAAANAAVDKDRYDRYQQNLQTTLSDVNKISTAGILDADFNDITDNYASLLKDLSDNYDVIRNPQRNLQKWSELKTKEAQLRSSIDQSKSQKVYLDESNDFLNKNPRWNTTQNRELLNKYSSSPRGERSIFDFKPPFNASISAIADLANKGATAADSRAEIVGNGNYIKTTKGTTVDSSKFDNIVLAALNGQDEFGTQLRRGFEEQYNELPEFDKQKYQNIDDFVLKNARAYMGIPQVLDTKLDENQVALQRDRQNFQAGQNALDRALQKRGQDIQVELAGQKKVDPQLLGAYKNELVTKFFETGVLPLDILQNIYGNNNQLEIEVEQGDAKIKRKAPTSEVIASKRQPDGTIIIDIRNNTKNGAVTRRTLKLEDLNADFNKVLGNEEAGKVSDASRKWLKAQTGQEQYDYDKVKSKFNVAAPEQAAADQTNTAPTGYTNPARINYKGQVVNAGVKNGKWYNTQTGEELK